MNDITHGTAENCQESYKSLRQNWQNGTKLNGNNETIVISTVTELKHRGLKYNTKRKDFGNIFEKKTCDRSHETKY